MKKLILFAAILFAGVSVVSVQSQNVKPNYQSKGPQTVTEGSNPKASTNLTVQLNSIQSISVNTSNVTLAYTTVADYTNGVRSGFIPNHLEVNSTGAYDIAVTYTVPNDSYTETETVGLTAAEIFESINVAVQRATLPAGVTYKAKNLATTAGESLITSTIGEFGANFDIDYIGAATYINSIKGGTPRTYTATVNYAIITK